MYVYEQTTGKLFKQGALNPLGIGWSGQEEGRNNPQMQGVSKIGPIPCGFFTIGPAFHHPVLGPLTMDLTPAPGNQMFGRDLFRIHGFGADPAHASEGCIIQEEPTRKLVAENLENDNLLQVVESY